MSLAATPIAPPLWFAPVRVGQHPALDFLNSIATPVDDPMDFLLNSDTLSRWLAESGVMHPHQVQATQRFSPRQLGRLARDASTLREWYREILLRWASGGATALHEEDLRHFNELMAKGEIRQSVTSRGSAIDLTTERLLADPEALIAHLAFLCADLLASESPDRVRKCENPVCSLWFCDNQRGPRRRWCSMALCGNRMKVAAHRHRLRDKGCA